MQLGKMNNIINKFLLEGAKFIPEIHLRQSQFTYRACGPFTKNKERIQKLRKTGDTYIKYIYRNELDKACFQDDIVYGDLKDLKKEHMLITFQEIKYLILLEIQNMMDIKGD